MSNRPLCKECGINTVRSKGRSRDGRFVRLDGRCQKCHSKRYPKVRELQKTWAKENTARKRYLKDDCECCGFVPVHKIQLHLDHKDGNRANNHPSNYQTLCANCHALKTLREGDMDTPSRSEPPYRWDYQLQQWVENIH